MSHFYGGLQGNRGPATRAGTKASGVSAYVQSWTGRIEVSMLHSETDDRDYGDVTLKAGPSGHRRSIPITDGPIDVTALTEAVVFDAETAKHLRQARASIQRANAAAVKACTRRDELSRKAA